VGFVVATGLYLAGAWRGAGRNAPATAAPVGAAPAD